jgi:2-polyprenyl-3-methyl-5-hydroxy-6-metoxy-1,4-benzoquinol methylase
MTRGTAPTTPDLSYELQSEPLFTVAEADAWAEELRATLREDSSARVRRALDSEIGRQIRSFGGWFQRVSLPEHGITTTSDPEMVKDYSPGLINRFGDRLTPQEGATLRPLPKWKYIERLLPPLAGRSVLEIGSSNGCFSLLFAALGASRVTGVESLRAQSRAAAWAARVVGADQVSFRNTDVLVDRTIEPHDIVFLSEVHNHFPLPFFGLARIINLARELVIFDSSGVITDAPNQLLYEVRQNPGSNRINFVHTAMSESTMVQFFQLIGIPASRIRAYRSPLTGAHVLYLIDTRNVATDRLANGYPQYLEGLFEAL